MTEQQKRILRVAIHARDPEALADLLRKQHLDVGGGGARQQRDGTATTEAYVPAEQLEQIEKMPGVEVKVIEDMTETGKQRQAEVGQGDRFEGGKITPHGLGRKE